MCQPCVIPAEPYSPLASSLRTPLILPSPVASQAHVRTAEEQGIFPMERTILHTTQSNCCKVQSVQFPNWKDWLRFFVNHVSDMLVLKRSEKQSSGKRPALLTWQSCFLKRSLIVRFYSNPPYRHRSIAYNSYRSKHRYPRCGHRHRAGNQRPHRTGVSPKPIEDAAPNCRHATPDDVRLWILKLIPTLKGDSIYVRSIKSGKHGEYFQLVESFRDEGTVKKRVLVHLGQHESVEEALNEWPEEIEFLRRFKRYDQANRLQDKLNRLRELTRKEQS